MLPAPQYGRVLTIVCLRHLVHALNDDKIAKERQLALGIHRTQIFPPDISKLIVQEAETCGFDNREDSIDGIASVDIYVVYRAEPSECLGIYSLIEPYLEPLRLQLATIDSSAPNKLDWAFLRKYKAGELRKGLQGHVDANLHTITIQLNPDFEGGSLWFSCSECCNGAKMRSCQLGPRPGVEVEGAYIPGNVSVGEGMIYPKGVWHGILPVTSGVRYSMALFYDEPVQKKKGIDEQFTVTFVNEMKYPAKLAWSNFAGELSIIREEWAPGQGAEIGTYLGHVFVALDAQMRELKRWKIVDTNFQYRLLDEDFEVLEGKVDL